MIEPPEPQPDSVSAEVNLKIAGAQVRLGLTVPTAPVRAGAILPVFRSLAEAIEADVASDLEKQGKRISCRAGCGACCRQLVPVTQVEARHLAELVGGFPEPRLSTVLARFAEAIRRLDEAGMLDKLGHPERISPEQREAVGLAYFALGNPLPVPRVRVVLDPRGSAARLPRVPGDLAAGTLCRPGRGECRGW